MEKKMLSVIAPMYNEEALVCEYCRVTLQVLSQIGDYYNAEVVLVNDGSKDKTLEKMMSVRKQHPDTITVVNLSRNFGLEGAVSAGLKRAVGDAVIVMDADLQDPPELILDMVKKWENGAEIVVAARDKRNSDNFFKRESASLYYKLLNALSGKITLEQNAANYRLLSRKALDQVLELPEVNGVFRVVVPFVGMKTETVKYDRDKRLAGKTKYNLKSMIRYALDSLTGISIEPLRKVVWSVVIAAVLFVGFIVGTILSSGMWKIGFMICSVICVLFGLLFICLSIFAEYIGQIMIEVKGRPTSVIYEYLPCENAKEKVK